MSDPVVPYMHIKAKSYHISQEVARELASIVIEWGVFENAISLDLEQLRQYPVVLRLSDATPGAFGAKLKLWRRSIEALYPTVNLYNSVAEEILTKGRIVALHRHRLIHGLWRPAGEDEPDAFQVLAGLDRRKDLAFFTADAEYLAAVHDDIKKLSNAAWSFNVNRMMHGAQGLLSAVPAPSGGHPVPPTPPSDEKP